MQLSIRKMLGFVVIGLCLIPTVSWARLPRPIRAIGVVTAVDSDTQTIVFKSAIEEDDRARERWFELMRIIPC